MTTRSKLLWSCCIINSINQWWFCMEITGWICLQFLLTV